MQAPCGDIRDVPYLCSSTYQKENGVQLERSRDEGLRLRAKGRLPVLSVFICDGAKSIVG